jgi:hypothetical protein
LLVAEFSLIESEDDTEKLGIFWFLSQTHYNAMPSRGVGDRRLLASQAHARW